MPEIGGETAPGFDTARAAFAANLAGGQEVGAAVAVYLHGRKVVDLWGGIADPEDDRPSEHDTLQVVYSATKSVTAACALLLAQRGELDLDAPVAEYWPEFAANGKEHIPVRWLLTHQAGLPTIDHPITPAEAIPQHRHLPGRGDRGTTRARPVDRAAAERAPPGPSARPVRWPASTPRSSARSTGIASSLRPHWLRRPRNRPAGSTASCACPSGSAPASDCRRPTRTGTARPPSASPDTADRSVSPTRPPVSPSPT